MITKFDEKIFFIKSVTKCIIGWFSFLLFGIIIPHSLALCGLNIFPAFNVKEFVINVDEITKILLIILCANIICVILAMDEMIDACFERFKFSKIADLFRTRIVAKEMVCIEETLDHSNSFLYSNKTMGLLE